MNKWIAIVILSALAMTASAADDKKKTTAPAAKQLVIPKEATANPDGTYSYTDKAGAKWIYIKTPFGVSKTQEATGAPTASSTPPGQYLKATDNGDTVKFERQSPFGVAKWEKKKSDLNDEERLVLQQQKAAKPEPKQP